MRALVGVARAPTVMFHVTLNKHNPVQQKFKGSKVYFAVDPQGGISNAYKNIRIGERK